MRRKTFAVKDCKRIYYHRCECTWRYYCYY